MAVIVHLRRLRRARDWTQDQLAEMLIGLGLKADRQQISTWERGLHVPNLETALAIAHLFGVHPDEVFEFKPH